MYKKILFGIMAITALFLTKVQAQDSTKRTHCGMSPDYLASLGVTSGSRTVLTSTPHQAYSHVVNLIYIMTMWPTAQAVDLMTERTAQHAAIQYVPYSPTSNPSMTSATYPAATPYACMWTAPTPIPTIHQVYSLWHGAHPTIKHH